MITTIQLNENVKRELEKLKERRNESYEDVIVKLLDEKVAKGREQEELIKEGCIEMYDEMKRIDKEWESTLMDGLDPDEKWEIDDS